EDLGFFALPALVTFGIGFPPEGGRVVRGAAEANRFDGARQQFRQVFTQVALRLAKLIANSTFGKTNRPLRTRQCPGLTLCIFAPSRLCVRFDLRYDSFHAKAESRKEKPQSRTLPNPDQVA